MINPLQLDVVDYICGLFTKWEFKKAGYQAIVAVIIVYILFFVDRNHYARCKLISNGLCFKLLVSFCSCS